MVERNDKFHEGTERCVGHKPYFCNVARRRVRAVEPVTGRAKVESD